MYDLLILGALMVHDRTGYKLRQILEGNLEPRRQISNGVMYPLLHKLAQAGYIKLSNVVVKGREQKLATITDAGREYFKQLMHTPIPMDAKRESTFRFKFRALGRENVGFQRETLRAYIVATEADVEVYSYVSQHLSAVAKEPDRTIDVGWSIRTLTLEKQLAMTKLEWANNQLEQLRSYEDDATFIELPDAD